MCDRVTQSAKFSPIATIAKKSGSGSHTVYTILKKAKKIFLQGAFKLMFENVKSPLDVFKVFSTRENDLS